MSQKTIRLSSEFNHLVLQTVQIEAEKHPDETLSAYYQKCMEQAHTDGIPKHQVSETVLHILDQKLYELKKQKEPNIDPRECQINRSLYFRISSRTDFRNPDKVRNTKTDPHVDQDNSSIYTGINADSINRVKQLKLICNLIIEKLTSCEDIFNGTNPNDKDEFLQQWDARLANCTDAFDEKTKIPQNTELLLLSCMATEASINDVGKLFMQKRIQQMDIQRKFLTSKQAKKFSCREDNCKLPILQPHSQDTAVFIGYLGQQCHFCNSWKTRPTNDSHIAKCSDCNETFQIQTITKCPQCQRVYFKEDLFKLIQLGGRCPFVNCRREIRIPDTLKQYVLNIERH